MLIRFIGFVDCEEINLFTAVVNLGDGWGHRNYSLYDLNIIIVGDNHLLK